MKRICTASEPISLTDQDQDSFEQLLIAKAPCVAQEMPAFLLLHAYDSVQIGAIINGNLKLKLPFRIEDLMDLRLFGQMGELHVWRIAVGLAGRLRVDNSERPDDGCWVKEEFHGMWGTKAEFEDGWWKLSEKQTSPIYVPFIAKPEMFYKVRNYYTFDENGQPRCEDARLCGFFYNVDEPVDLP
jgi:CRISPR-associated protein (TIGR03984 family)